MKVTKVNVFALCALLLLPGCTTMSNTAKGSIIGGGGGGGAPGKHGEQRTQKHYRNDREKPKSSSFHFILL